MRNARRSMTGMCRVCVCVFVLCDGHGHVDQIKTEQNKYLSFRSRTLLELQNWQSRADVYAKREKRTRRTYGGMFVPY